MKIFGRSKAKQAIEQSVEHNKQQEVKLLGTIRRTPGLKLYEWDTSEGVVREVNVEIITTASVEFVDGELRHVGKAGDGRVNVDMQSKVYFEALNIKSAHKKVIRYLEGRSDKLFNLKTSQTKLPWFT